MLSNIYHRIYDKVQYKLSLIFISLYIVIYNYQQIETDILSYLGLAVVTSIGIAGLGYILNDYKDLQNDIKNNKRNIFIQLNKNGRVIITVLFLCLAGIPWLYFPFDLISFLLIAFELLLFFIYAFPPFRLKEKGFWGIICDSLYAQVIPCSLAAYTFYKIQPPKVFIAPAFIIIGICWLFIIGIRNILIHQIDDFENDKNTDTQTFATNYGKRKTMQIVYKTIFPIEILLFITLLYILPKNGTFIIILYIIYTIAIYLINKEQFRKNFAHYINQRILNEFYEIYLPALLLLIYYFSGNYSLYIPIFHLLLFAPIYLKSFYAFAAKYF